MIKIFICFYLSFFIALFLKCLSNEMHPLNGNILSIQSENSNNFSNISLEEVKIRRLKVEILKSLFNLDIESEWHSVQNESSSQLTNKRHSTFTQSTGKLIALYVFLKSILIVQVLICIIALRQC